MGSKEDGSCLHSGNDAAIRRRGTAGNIIGDKGGRGRMFFFGANEVRASWNSRPRQPWKILGYTHLRTTRRQLK